MSENGAFVDDTEDRLNAVRERIAQAAVRVGRQPREVTLVAVSKTFPAARVLEFARHGQLVFGENRVQEAKRKIPEITAAWSGEPLTWRLVGHLQRNKVKQALDLFDQLDGVDSLRLLKTVGAEAVRRGCTVPVLLQFNCSEEATKSGFDPTKAEVVAEQVSKEQGVEPRGVMTIGPLSDDPEVARPAFRRLVEVRERLVKRLARPLPEVSMGMSHDMEVAIEEGATVVRVGSALFGARA
jgi:pyridoxal phosphate enzyme (YggS family)